MSEVDKVFKNKNVDDLAKLSNVFEDCDFGDCNFQEFDFSQYIFNGCNFDNCNLSLAKVKKAQFNDCKFTNSKLVGVNWTLLNLGLSFDIEFRNCNLDISDFSGMDLKKLVATSCSFREVYFADCDLSETNLTDSDFSRTTFYRTKLNKADLRKATNYEINISENSIAKAKFSFPEVISLLDSLDIEIDKTG
jgi:fluoroquinolone resistance protein